MQRYEPKNTGSDETEGDSSTEEKPRIRSARDAAHLLKHIARAEQEHFYVLGLDSIHRVVITQCVAIGTADRVHVTGRDVFRELIRHNCSVFFVAHNHPSGNPTASRGDLELTLGLQLAGELLGIELLDHLILAGDCFYSIREEVFLPNA